MFRQLGIYTAEGQKYTPHDADQIMYYREDQTGQILEEGINESGAFCAWLACATSYSNNNYAMIPFYIFYSMFGFQRVGDLTWAAGDSQARGFLIGATAGRTTLNGEGLQHADGHSHVMANLVPNCISYDPTYAYELTVIIQDGMRRMYQDQENKFYYITVMNENYHQPEMPQGVEAGIVKGMYLLRQQNPNLKKRVQLLGCGTILRELEAAAILLAKDFKVGADIWSATSFNELGREGREVRRWNLLNPTAKVRKTYVETCLEGRPGPVIAATDYVRAFADQIREYVPATYKVLGTDGYGRSDTREKLREFFEVNRYFIIVAALQALAEDGVLQPEVVADAMKQFNIDSNKSNPVRL